VLLVVVLVLLVVLLLVLLVVLLLAMAGGRFARAGGLAATALRPAPPWPCCNGSALYR
jgi:hypothetical protein